MSLQAIFGDAEGLCTPRDLYRDVKFGRVKTDPRIERMLDRAQASRRDEVTAQYGYRRRLRSSWWRIYYRVVKVAYQLSGGKLGTLPPISMRHKINLYDLDSSTFLHATPHYLRDERVNAAAIAYKARVSGRMPS